MSETFKFFLKCWLHQLAIESENAKPFQHLKLSNSHKNTNKCPSVTWTPTKMHHCACLQQMFGQNPQKCFCIHIYGSYSTATVFRRVLFPRYPPLCAFEWFDTNNEEGHRWQFLVIGWDFCFLYSGKKLVFGIFCHWKVVSQERTSELDWFLWMIETHMSQDTKTFFFAWQLN